MGQPDTNMGPMSNRTRYSFLPGREGVEGFLQRTAHTIKCCCRMTKSRTFGKERSCAPKMTVSMSLLQVAAFDPRHVPPVRSRTCTRQGAITWPVSSFSIATAFTPQSAVIIWVMAGENGPFGEFAAPRLFITGSCADGFRVSTALTS